MIKFDFRKRLESTVFRHFLKNARRKDLIELGLSSSAASDTLKQLEHQEGRVDDNLISRTNLRLAKANKYDEVLRRWVPRIDHKVTIDLRRLLRMPTSIHGKTGSVARILETNEILEFDPMNEPTLFPSKETV
jgi:hypothetical protein